MRRKNMGEEIEYPSYYNGSGVDKIKLTVKKEWLAKPKDINTIVAYPCFPYQKK